MTLVFLSIFSWASPLMDFLERDGVRRAEAASIRDSGVLGGGALESLVVDGVIGGVGGVLIFLPQILILFGFLAILEDCGYMARAAFLMDRLLRWCGLSGKSFIPHALVVRLRGPRASWRRARSRTAATGSRRSSSRR